MLQPREPNGTLECASIRDGRQGLRLVIFVRDTLTLAGGRGDEGYRGEWCISRTRCGRSLGFVVDGRVWRLPPVARARSSRPRSLRVRRWGSSRARPPVRSAAEAPLLVRFCSGMALLADWLRRCADSSAMDLAVLACTPARARARHRIQRGPRPAGR